MKLAVSNIAWDPDEEAGVLDLLQPAGIAGIEVAPTKLWPDWEGASEAAARAVAERYAAQGFTVPSMQAILFGCPSLRVFGDSQDRASFLDHIEKVADIAAGLGAKVMVFGSPRNRDPGALSAEDAMRHAVDLFGEAGARCAARGTALGIEANPAVYDCRFLTRWMDAAELVRRCDNPGIVLHLDSACTALAGDDLVEAVGATRGILSHVHISEPHLAPIDDSAVDHAGFAGALRSAAYGGWCSVEMRRADDPLRTIERALELAVKYYG